MIRKPDLEARQAQLRERQGVVRRGRSPIVNRETKIDKLDAKAAEVWLRHELPREEYLALRGGKQERNPLA